MSEDKRFKSTDFKANQTYSRSFKVVQAKKMKASHLGPDANIGVAGFVFPLAIGLVHRGGSDYFKFKRCIQ